MFNRSYANAVAYMLADHFEKHGFRNPLCREIDMAMFQYLADSLKCNFVLGITNNGVNFSTAIEFEIDDYFETCPLAGECKFKFSIHAC